MRIPSSPRRSDAGTATEDRNRDGGVDRHDDRLDDEPPTADSRSVRVRDQVDDRGPAATTGVAAVPVVDRPDADRVDADRAATERAAAERAAERAEADRRATERSATDRTDSERADTDRSAETERAVDTAPAGPKPRASLLATLGLVVGVVAALLALSGQLSGYGVALGIAGLLLSIGGLSATGKRHVAGKSDALLGVVLSIGAMVLGALALTGALPWLTTETDNVDRLRQWLDTQFANRI